MKQKSPITGIVSALLILSACGSPDPTRLDASDCTPGQVVECPCPDGSTAGTRICNEDSAHFDICRCAALQGSSGKSHQPTERDVCAFTAEMKTGPVERDGMIFVAPAHPNIRYFGRIDCSHPSGPSFAYPGISIRARFTGPVIQMIFEDAGNPEQTNYYNIIIDKEPAVELKMYPGKHTYTLAQELSEGDHTVEIFKRVESNYGSGHGVFQGFRIAANAELLPLTPRPHRIEFVGDSITCGYGNMLAVDNPGDYHYTTRNENAYLSFAAITARAVDAELSIVAYSGRGAFRNYGGGDGENVPKLYNKTLPDATNSPRWDHRRFIPEIVVVNLGTNDFSPPLSDGKMATLRNGFHTAMDEFTSRLRAWYPHAEIILALGPMLSDQYPEGINARSTVKDVLRHIVNAHSAAGDSHMWILELPDSPGLWGEDWHPSAASHQKMADALIAFIRSQHLLPPAN